MMKQSLRLHVFETWEKSVLMNSRSAFEQKSHELELIMLHWTPTAWFLNFKAALINIFIVTKDEMTFRFYTPCQSPAQTH